MVAAGITFPSVTGPGCDLVATGGGWQHPMAAGSSSPMATGMFASAPETIDERVINVHPGNRFHVTENLNLAINAAKGIGGKGGIVGR